MALGARRNAPPGRGPACEAQTEPLLGLSSSHTPACSRATDALARRLLPQLETDTTARFAARDSHQYSARGGVDLAIRSSSPSGKSIGARCGTDQEGKRERGDTRGLALALRARSSLAPWRRESPASRATGSPNGAPAVRPTQSIGSAAAVARLPAAWSATPTVGLHTDDEPVQRMALYRHAHSAPPAGEGWAERRAHASLRVDPNDLLD